MYKQSMKDGDRKWCKKLWYDECEDSLATSAEENDDFLRIRRKVRRAAGGVQFVLSRPHEARADERWRDCVHILEIESA